jgi:recombination protein RecT
MEKTQHETRPVFQAPVSQRDETSNLKKFNRTLMNVDMQNYLATVLGSRKEQFINNLLAVVGNDVKLQACTPTSLIYAAIKATALGLPLDPNLGFAYIIPYKNTKKVKELQLIAQKSGAQPVEQEVTVSVKVQEAQFQIGWKGFVQLAQRTGSFEFINAGPVYDGELLGIDKKSGEPNLDGRKASDTVIGYFAYFKLLNGFQKTLYMPVEEVRKHATKYSQTFSSSLDYIRNSSKWTTDFEAMATKTVIKLLLSKYAPLAPDAQTVAQLNEAIRADQGVIDDQGNPDYVDGTTDEHQTEVAVEERKDEMRKSDTEAPALL